uniref:Uncharacterized protein n=1 Tax=Meloidogyne enterolobii TaxID=390850 RepID=A0A6V7X7Y9_MELEN|nr:unnamed protein product [Meloidogyne enterolobii]
MFLPTLIFFKFFIKIFELFSGLFGPFIIVIWISYHFFFHKSTIKNPNSSHRKENIQGNFHHFSSKLVSSNWGIHHFSILFYSFFHVFVNFGLPFFFFLLRQHF